MTIYYQSYWQPHCPNVPVGLDLSVMNINVNGGTGRGTRLIQQCLEIPVDGVWGKQTTAAVINLGAAGDVARVIKAFHDDERAFYQAIINHEPDQQKFAADWFGRNDRCERLALTMIAQEDQKQVDAALDQSLAEKPSIMKES